MCAQQKGIALPFVIALAFILAIVGYSILTLAQQEIIQTRIEADKTKAFYNAESGIAKLSEILERPLAGDLDHFYQGTIEQGAYRVDIVSNSSSCYATSTGASGVVQKKIRVQLNFLASPFENAIWAMNNAGGNWAFQLRGTGNPVASGIGEKGGKDIINGNIFVDGDAFLYEQSMINQAPAPNPWQLNGDLGATGNISVLGSAHVAGATYPHAEEPPAVDVVGMDYAANNTHNVSQIFQNAHVTSGYLPSDNPLRNVFVKNPSDRSAECNSTAGDDYFLEPSAVTMALVNQKDATTPLNLGNDRVYYVDGNVWIHSQSTYGFNVTGKATIVATGNIHICDNTKYANADSMLGLVSLGKYDSSGNRISGGDIFFGDPRYGTMYTISGMMFAANDFLYNSDAVSRQSAEPTTGFTVNGCFAAMGKVQVERDWYTKTTTSGFHTTTEARAARYDSATGQWVDSLAGTALSSTESGTLKHYQMIVNYDDRVRNPSTRPPGLPRGLGRIFAGFSNWQEL